MNTTRREFLRATAASVFTIVPPHVLASRGRKRPAPSDTVTRATIGTGGMGMGHVHANKEDGPIVQLAVCDVDRNHLGRALKKAGRGCRGYADFREVLDRRDIDTVHIATPDHWHALITIAAVQSGRDVFCEKPMTRFIREGQAVIEAVNRYGRIVQHNTYGRGGWQKYRKLIAGGLLGTPVTVYLSRATGFDFKVKEWSGRTNLRAEKVPPVLDYEMWLGPAPFKPYHPARVHGSFRGYWDYAGGGLSDMGQHWIDPIQYFLGKDDTGPVEVEAHAPWPQHPDACGLWGRVTLTYGDGTKIILESGEWGKPLPGEQPFVSGPRGKVYRRRVKGKGMVEVTEPEGLWERVRKLPEPPRLISFQEAVRARVKGLGVKPNAEEAHRSVSLLHLANIAIRAGRKIRWGPVRQVIVGDAEANRLVDVPMRAPWRL
jgi:predicted dehydrogenase